MNNNEISNTNNRKTDRRIDNWEYDNKCDTKSDSKSKRSKRSKIDAYNRSNDYERIKNKGDSKIVKVIEEL